MDDQIIKKFGNHLRVRVSGVLIQDGRMLMVLHRTLGAEGLLWAPPGGGMNFGSNAVENLVREFREETGLIVECKRFLFINEYLAPPLHAMELFFEVRQTGGALFAGVDPEMPDENQIIEKTAFLSKEDISHIRKDQLHNIFRNIADPERILQMRGFHLMGDETYI
jgi:8-oxo-dGTP diphosphatase